MENLDNPIPVKGMPMSEAINDDFEFARIILPQQRGDSFTDALGFIARRDHRHNRRPRSIPSRCIVVKLAAEPKLPAAEQEIKPDNEYH